MTGTSLDVAPAIRTPDQRIRVFVSSTLDELAPERAAARQAIAQLRLTPVLFELGARPYPPRDLYRAYLAQSDVFVGIYWQRYGWVAPGMDVSGLEDEERLAAGKPRLIYIKTPAPQREPRLQALLDRLRAEEVASYQKFTTADELREALANDLAVLLTERFAGATQPSPSPTLAPAPVHFKRPALLPLPLPRDRLIDRAQEVAITSDLLRSDSGLVTLTGPGGVGKTRVALAAAAQIADQFADGVAFFSLAALTDPQLVVATIAQGLGVAGEERRPVGERLLEALRDKQLLLVLDNLEQMVAAAAPWIATALAAAPRLKILATSREPLRVRGEHVVSIPPLAVPDQDVGGSTTTPDVARLAEVASVELFVARARELQPDFALTRENAAAVAEICRRLDGLPLAIELAVARLPVLPPEGLLARLERRLPLLTHGPRDLPARQQTLRATLAWSYDLLTDRDKTLFRQLAVFAGGGTLAAAQAVCRVANPGDGESERDSDPEEMALEGVASLVDQSLLQMRTSLSGEVRVAMLETIREYALEQLQASGETAAVQHRHAAYFLGLAEEALPHMYDADRDEWLVRLEDDEANLRAALAWTTENQRELSGGGVPEQAGSMVRETGLRLAGVLSYYWYMSGKLQEGRSWLERVLAQAGATEHLPQSASGQAALGVARFGLAGIALAQGDTATAAAQSALSEAIFRALGPAHKLWLAYVLMQRGMVRISMGAPAEARPLLEESVALRREVGGDMGRAFVGQVLFQLGRAAQAEGDLESARTFYEQSLVVFRASSDTMSLALAANAARIVAATPSDEERARQMLAESLPPARRTRDRYERAQLLVDAGMTALRQGDPLQAQNLLAESLHLWGDIGAQGGLARALAGLAEVATAREQAERAGRLYGAAQALLPPSGRLTTDTSGLEIDQNMTAARARLDPAAFAAGWTAGQLMTAGQATDYAREATEQMLPNDALVKEHAMMPTDA
jgi:predicted ATPase